jgi:hypothetical protein
VFEAPRNVLIDSFLEGSREFVNGLSLEVYRIVTVGNLAMKELICLIENKMANVSFIFYHKTSF